MALNVQALTSIDNLQESIGGLRADVERGFDEAKARGKLFFLSVMDSTISLIILTDLLKNLNHVRQSQGDDETFCLPNTRTELLRAIHSWIDTKSEGNLFWLSAIAGWGKTTVSATIRNQYVDAKPNIRQRGAWFFCNRDNKPEGSANLGRIIPTIAYQLTHAFPGIKAALVERLDTNQDIMSLNIENQVRQLISEPLQTLIAPVSGPIVCIIDGLDACTDASEASLRAFFKCVNGSIVPLPPWLKFLVTSRPMEFVGDQQSALKYRNIDINHPDNRADVETYIEHRLDSTQKKRNLITWPKEKFIKDIDERTGGLFRSAQTVLDFLDRNSNDDVVVLLGYLFKARRGNSPSESLRLLYSRIVFWEPSNDDDDNRRAQRS